MGAQQRTISIARPIAEANASIVHLHEGEIVHVEGHAGSGQSCGQG
jgi:hypothetical protein